MTLGKVAVIGVLTVLAGLLVVKTVDKYMELKAEFEVADDEIFGM